MKGTPKARAFNVKYRDNPEAIATYLNKALATGDPVLVTKAIGDMIRAQGMTKFAQKAGILRNEGRGRAPEFPLGTRGHAPGADGAELLGFVALRLNAAQSHNDDVCSDGRGK